MKVISVPGPKLPRFKNPVLAIGVFDGVHVGHQHLIQQVIRKARAIDGTSLVMTFSPHPVQVLYPHGSFSLLTPLSCRLSLFAQLGVDVCLVVKFTKAFSRLGPHQFMRQYLAGMIKPKEIIVGDDFKFGHDRQGHLDILEQEGKRYGFIAHEVASVRRGGYDISSTLIRQLIARGRFTIAQKLLGRRVSVFGKVIRGDARGNILGFPTANLDVRGCVLPPRGVYVCRAIMGNKAYGAMTNIGTRPSFAGAGLKVHCEVHFFDFHRNIYGQNILVEFIRKLRDEKKFSSPAALVAQLKKDEAMARRLLSGL